MTAGRLEHGNGMVPAVISNRIRAMVMLLAEPGDPGVHATDPADVLRYSDRQLHPAG